MNFNFMYMQIATRLPTRLASLYRQEHLEFSLSQPTHESVVEMAFGSSLLHSMWCALKFAEAIKYPGKYIITVTVLAISMNFEV